MAYQSLNIIGSLTAGTNLVQGQSNADRQRMEAYRSLLKDQVTQRKPDGTGNDPIEVNATSDRITIGDAPEERRPPYQAYPSPAAEPDGKEPGPTDDTPAAGPPDHLDVVI
jgi:hypothetical protein